MNTRVNARLIMALLVVLAVGMSFRVGLAQDGGDVEKDWANLESVGGIAQTADNLNVSAAPTQEQAQNAVNPDPVDVTLGPDLPPVKSLMSPVCCPFVLLRTSRHANVLAGPPVHAKPAHQDLKIIWQDSNDDATLVVFEDYSVIMTNADGEAWFWGYVGISSGDGHVVIAGADFDGDHFVLDNGSVLGLLADGDVLMGNPTRWYVYDYDEDGNFVGLYDSDDNDYAVETTDDGGFTITDPAGDTGNFNPDGSYDILDQAGNVLDQGALFGENDDDSVSGGDEYAGGDEYSGGGDYTGGGDEYSGGGD